VRSHLSAEQFGLLIPELVKLYEALPLKEAVVEKWGNAKRVLRPPDVRHGGRGAGGAAVAGR
jgi:hypothetical protein